jgi:hypothetical protein
MENEEKKQAPRPNRKKPVDTKDLLLKIDKLERVIAKLAHYSGQHKIMVDFGIEPYMPGKEEMSKYRDV